MSATTVPTEAPGVRESRGDVPDLHRYALGAAVRCDDGPCGYLGRLVVNPLDQTITHAIVEPRHRHARARLVPIAMIDNDADGLRVCCTTAAFGALQHAEEAEFLPVPEPSPPGFPSAGTGTPIMLQWPHYTAARHLHMHERVPLGDIEIRRGERLDATDATVGKVEGLIVDQANTQVTHILLQQGHLWGARQITIPINAVAHIDGRGVHVSLTKHQIDALPEIELAQRQSPAKENR